MTNEIKSSNVLNGHTFVDLGLPSGIKWATCNVGATNPEQFGDYFAWGETGPKKDYEPKNYKFHLYDKKAKRKKFIFSKYYRDFDDHVILEPCDDTATANWGEGWRMPARDEMQELIDNCIGEWATINGVNGRLFTGPNGNSVFFPAGDYNYDNKYNSCGYYWSSVLNQDSPYSAYSLYVCSPYASVDAGNTRCNGFSVRAVCGHEPQPVPIKPRITNKNTIEEILKIEDGVLVKCHEDYEGDLIIPNSVTKIGRRAFLGCRELKSVVIPDSVTIIEREAFLACCELESVTIPDSVTSIGDFAFYNCDSLESIVIPKSVTSIGAHLFYNCSSLKSVSIPDSVTSICARAFFYCSGLTSLTIPDSVTSIGECAFAGCNKLKTITISSSLTSIAKGAFANCGKLSVVDIPNSVTKIERNAFCGCRSLSSITIPASVREIYRDAFLDCDKLTSLYYGGDIESWCGISFELFNSNPLYCTHNLYINNELVTDFVVPSSIKEIKNYSFYGATCLKSVKFHDSVTRVGLSAFYNCTGLTGALSIPDSVTSLSNGAFGNCTGLTSVSIPKTVTDLGRGTFFNTAWYNSQPDGIVYLDGWCLGYKGEKPSGNLVIKKGAKGIVGYAFYICTELISVTIPASVEYIGENAFCDCHKLTSVTIPASVKKIGKEVFKNCRSLSLETKQRIAELLL